MEENKINNNKSFDIIKVSGHSNVNKVAGAIAAMFNERGYAKMRVIGAAALNQAIKSSAIARSMLSEKHNVAIIPNFSTIKFDSKEETAIDLEIIEVNSKEK